MKHLAVFAVALTIFSSSTAQAGDLTPPKMEEAIIVNDTKAGSSSSAMVIVALTGLFMFAVISQ